MHRKEHHGFVGVNHNELTVDMDSGELGSSLG